MKGGRQRSSLREPRGSRCRRIVVDVELSRRTSASTTSRSSTSACRRQSFLTTGRFSTTTSSSVSGTLISSSRIEASARAPASTGRRSTTSVSWRRVTARDVFGLDMLRQRPSPRFTSRLPTFSSSSDRVSVTFAILVAPASAQPWCDRRCRRKLPHQRRSCPAHQRTFAPPPRRASSRSRPRWLRAGLFLRGV